MTRLTLRSEPYRSPRQIPWGNGLINDYRCVLDSFWILEKSKYGIWLWMWSKWKVWLIWMNPLQIVSGYCAVIRGASRHRLCPHFVLLCFALAHRLRIRRFCV